MALLIFACMAIPTIDNTVFECIAAGSLMPAYKTIDLWFLFAPFVTEVALRIFLTVAEALGNIAGSRKKQPRELTDKTDADD